jgi:ABC-type iron transport system FetAB permease component
MTSLVPARTPVFSRALVLGALGGIALVLVQVFSTRGPLIFLPYIGLFVALAALVARHRAQRFSARTVASFAAFVLSTAMSWLYVMIVANPQPLWQPSWLGVWHVMLVFGAGALLAAAVAYITE